MAKKRNSKADGRDGAGLRGSDLRQLVPALGLMAVVLGTLILGAALQSGEEPTSDGDPAEFRPPDAVETAPPAAASVPEVRPAESVTPGDQVVSPPARSAPTGIPRDLQGRTASDFERLGSHRGAWTLQLMIACEPDNVASMIEKSANSDRLFILPSDYRGRSCYRLCWGVYSSRDDADAARDLPAAIRREIGSPAPREIAVVVP